MLGKRAGGRGERGKREAERKGERQGHKEKGVEKSGNRNWELDLEIK